MSEAFLVEEPTPSRGQCGPTALVLLELFGGDLLLAPVERDGVPCGHHYWNRLPAGVELDLTADQWQTGETVGDSEVVVIPASGLGAGVAPYLLLRKRVRLALGLPPSATPWVVAPPTL